MYLIKYYLLILPINITINFLMKENELINNKIYIRRNYNYWKLTLRSRARKLIRVFYLHFIYIKYMVYLKEIVCSLLLL